MEPEETSSGPPPSAPIIGAEDEDFENDIEAPPQDQSSAFLSLELLRGRPTHLLAFLSHLLLQFDCCPALCYLHAAMLRGLNPKEGRKQLLEFCHLFLEKTGLLRVPLPHQVQIELERTRPELLPEELQRRWLQEIQEFQEPEVSRQLEDFRSKRLMGMTPGEQELGELESYRTRDPWIREAKEKQLAEGLLGRLEEMHLTICPDEEKSSAIFGAIVTYMRFLGVKPRGGGEGKKPKGNFFRKKLGRKEEPPPPKTRRGFTLPGAALWGGGSECKQSHEEKAPPPPPPRPGSPPPGPARGGGAPGAPHPPAPRPPPPPERRGGPKTTEKMEGGGMGRPRVGGGAPLEPPPPGGPPLTTQPTPGGGTEGEKGLDPPEQGTPPPKGPPEPPPSEPSEEGAENERRKISLEPGGSGGGEPPPQFIPAEDLDPDPPAWRDLVPPPHLGGLSRREVKRQEGINELLQTEHAHVRTLRVLLELFHHPMLQEGFFQEQELCTIFPGLEDLVEAHALFLESLKKLREESGGLVTNIGDVLLARFAGPEGSWFQKLSGRFCSRQPFALQQLKGKQRRDPRFCHFIQEAEAQPRCRRLQLKDIIPSEMQRLTKYPLLLHTIAHCTDPGPERVKVEQARECCRRILGGVNREVKEMENMMKLRDYQRRIDLSGLKQSPDPLLSEFRNTDLTKRTLVHEGPLTWRVSREKAVEVQVLVLEDLLVLLQKQEERLLLRCQNRTLTPPDGKQSLSPIIRLRCAITRQVATDPRAFYVIVSWENGAQIYELVAPSLAERKHWCAVISETAGSLSLPGGALHPKTPPRGNPHSHSPLDSENGGTLKEPLPLDGRAQAGAVEGTESGGDPEKAASEGGGEGAVLETPPQDPQRGEGGLARSALSRVWALLQVLPGGAGDGAPSPPPPEAPRGGPHHPPPPEERHEGDGAESEGEGGGSGGPPNAPHPPFWGGSRPLLSLPPQEAAWVGGELRALRETLRRLQDLELRYWELRGGGS